jgi:uracil-DNA glycosylase
MTTRRATGGDSTPAAPAPPSGPQITTLARLRSAEESCTRCSLYKFATQVVPGEGQGHARLMLVGEQPGDFEDKTGKPFVGPAGKILDNALQEAGIARAETFVTNAVKHFKHEMRGKRRLHKRPDASEVAACHGWLAAELAIVRPRVIVALGATAARSLLGRPVTIASARATIHELPGAKLAFVTIHPSFLLRLRDAAQKEREYQLLVGDLRRAHKASVR